MNTLEVGKKLVELCNSGKAEEAMKTLYSPEIVSVEAQAMPNMPAEMRGLSAVLEKGKWWNDNHVIHSSTCKGPFPHGDRFACLFAFDVTNKPSNQRFQMEEVAVYTVKDGKIVREEFFYTGG
ncbi:MAG TPA: nuclear transport factor 2 family protein [Kofleriaceae bacterium]|nr:nuclear transport factor 2 family protein [Kofleriaceae bacterium]